REGDLLALEVGRTFDAAVLRHQKTDVVLLDESGDRLDRQSLGARDRHRRQRGMTDIVFAIADDLHGGNGAVAIFQHDIETVLGEEPLLRREMERRLRSPWRPVEPDGYTIGRRSRRIRQYTRRQHCDRSQYPN